MIKILVSLFWLMVSLSVSGCVTVSNQPSDQSGPWSPQARAQIHVDLGMEYLRKGRMDVAGEEFALALEADRRFDQAYHGQGLLMARLGKPDEAEALLKKTMELNPTNFVAVNDYGILLCESVGSYESWHETWIKADSAQNNPVQNNPTNKATIEEDEQFSVDPARKGLATLLRALADPQNNQYLATHLGLGLCYQRLGEYKAASMHLGTVLTMQPDMPHALIAMSEVAFLTQDYMASRAYIERYFSASRFASSRSLALAARTELALGDQGQARRYWTELKNRLPELEPMETALAFGGNGGV